MVETIVDRKTDFVVRIFIKLRQSRKGSGSVRNRLLNYIEEDGDRREKPTFVVTKTMAMNLLYTIWRNSSFGLYLAMRNVWHAPDT